ncbi:MAG: Ig-like domain-containing protein, partial [Saccharospirillaceae bacterium]|nr:Ig-like domain-containing protein [Saccharospirillaceae bacterium]
MNPLTPVLILLSLCAALLSAQTHAAGIQIINADGSGEGFNDATAVSAVGGNNATTLGAQRLAVFSRAADILNATFDIAVTVNVNSSFDPLFCTTNSATLGSAGAANYQFVNDGGVWTVYADALANQLQGSDVEPAQAEINAQFNSGIGNPGCLQSSGWYLGFDDPAGNGNSLLSVVLHEIMHGMGFLSLLASDGSSAATYGPEYVYDPYTKLLYDHTQGARVTTLNQSQRAAATINNGNLVWDGAQTNAQLGGLSSGVNSNRMRMYAPASYTPGSSVSHFDTAATPNEIMEPQYTEFLDDAGLAKYLLADIGWTLASAGSNAPVMNAVSAQTLDEDTTLNVTVSATDADGDALSYSIASAPAALGASISGTTLTIAPQANYNGTGSITVQVSDGSLTGSTSFNVTVNPVNDAPVFTSASSFNTANDTDLVITLTASDIDTASGSLVFSLVSADSARVSASLSGSILTLTPVADTTGTTTVDVAVSDGALSTTQSISVNVLSANNQAPVFNPPAALTLLQETSSVVTLSASDADGNSLTYSVGSVSSGVSATVSGDQLSILAADGFTGSASVSISVSDGLLNDSATLAITVLPKFGLQQEGITLGDGGSLNAELNALSLTLSGGDGQLSTSLFFDGRQQDNLLSYDATTQSLQPRHASPR